MIYGKDFVLRVYEMIMRRVVEVIVKFFGFEMLINFVEIDEKYEKVF